MLFRASQRRREVWSRSCICPFGGLTLQQEEWRALRGLPFSEEPGDVLLQGGERDSPRPVDTDRGDSIGGQQLVELAAGDGQGLGGLGHGQQEPAHAAPPASGRDGGYSRPTKCQSVTTIAAS